ncbi:MAG: GDP-mannose 4,6-dehydratase [bacterium]
MVDRVFVTGAGGFVGRHLMSFLESRELDQVGGLVHSETSIPRLKEQFPEFRFYNGDLQHPPELTEIFSDFHPDTVVHLAAISEPSVCRNQPRKAYEINVVGQWNLVETILETGTVERVLIAGSAREYGLSSKKREPLEESDCLQPRDPYAISKATQDHMGVHVQEEYEIDVYRTRAFNHSGPGQSLGHVCPDFARQIALIEQGQQTPPIRTGNLDPLRDFTDVRDVVRAYWMVLTEGTPGDVYNVCRGESLRVGSILERLIEDSDQDIQFQSKDSKKQNLSKSHLKGSREKITRELSWVPEISIDRMLHDVLEDWRERCR